MGRIFMDSAPFELRILGSTEVVGPGIGADDANLHTPKRMALLAYLALATADGYRRRDQIVGLFWPDLGQEAARTQLRKALFALRESLGAEAVVSRGEGEVRLAPDRVWCDAVALPRLAMAGRWAEALALYRGELLEGLFAEGVAQEFDEWLSDQRRTLREHAATSACECSRIEDERGDRKAAAVLARRALELTPDDENGVRRLMSLLDRQGDRGGALRVYTDWQVRLEKEYGVEPAPETRKLARKVQAARKGESHETPPTQAPVAVGPTVADASSPGGVLVPLPRARQRWPVLAGVAGVLLLGIGGVALARRGDPPAPSDPRSVAVLPLRPIGDITLASAGESVAEELTTALVQTGGLTVRAASRARDVVDRGGDVDRIGRGLGVAYVVDGGVQQGRGQLRVTLRLVRAVDGVAIWAGNYDMDAADRVVAARRVAAEAGDQIRAQLAGAAPQDTLRQ
jgi:DNA-binding SARP family transcriptional activator/TolB-like protein